MKTLLLAISMTLAALTLTLAPTDVDAKRLGAGKPAGMQRAAPPANAAPHNTPAQNAAPSAAPNTPAAAPAAAVPPKRNWMGPLAGVAAGLGIAALMGHMGLGGALGGAMGSLLTMLLVAGVAFFVIRFVMSRMRGGNANSAGPQLAGAGAPMGGWKPEPAPAPVQMQMPTALPRTAFDAAPAAAAATGFGAAGAAAAAYVPPQTLPGGMAIAEFERLAKLVFIRLQAANDSNNLDDLRKFTTPELFASLRLDLQERGTSAQQTDVVEIHALVVDTAHENNQDIVTVRYHGLIREAANAPAEPFKEVWHLVRPADGSADWAIAGITPEAVNAAA